MSSDRLVLYAGSTSQWDLPLVNEEGEDLSLSGADAASFTIKASVEDADSAAILHLDTTGISPGLSLDSVNKKLVASPTSTQMNALAPGVYIAQAGVRYGSATTWRYSDWVQVEVRARVAKVVTP